MSYNGEDPKILNYIFWEVHTMETKKMSKIKKAAYYATLIPATAAYISAVYGAGRLIGTAFGHYIIWLADKVNPTEE